MTDDIEPILEFGEVEGEDDTSEPDPPIEGAEDLPDDVRDGDVESVEDEELP